MKIYEKMYECSRCTSVFMIAIYRRPESMPCLHEPLHCPFCMSSGNTLTRIHKSLPDKRKRVGVPVGPEKTEPLTKDVVLQWPDFDNWWEADGRFFDPDTDDVPWFDKRKFLAEYAFNRAKQFAGT